MALMGAGAGAGVGFAAGGPGGALIGAGLGSMAEDTIFGAGAPSAAVEQPRQVTYGGTQYDYMTGMREADMRSAPLANYSMADQDRILAMQARQDQLLELERLRATARGEGPSAAALQMAQAQEQAAANAANLAASARGTGAQALATRDAIRAQMQGAQTSARDTAILRAQEALQAQQAATQLVTGMRGQAGQERGLSQAQAEFQARQQLASRGANDSRALALLQAQIEEEKARSGVASGNEQRGLDARLAQMQAEQARYRDQKDRDTRLGTALIAAGGSMAAASASKGGGGGSATGGQSGPGHAAGENPGAKGWLAVPDFSMFDELGNPVAVPGAPAPGLGAPMSVPPIEMSVAPPASLGAPVGAPAGLRASQADFLSHPAKPMLSTQAAPPVSPSGKPLSRLSDLQARAAPAGGPVAPPAGLGAGMPGIDAFAADTEALRAIRRQQIAQEFAKRPGFTPARPETRQDTSGQRQRSMGPDPEITQRQREIQSGPQRLERIAPPEIRYSPLDVLSVAEPPPEAKTDKQKIAWAKARAEALSKQGISMAQALATGELDQPKAPDLSWRPKNWDKLTGEEQDAIEAARVTAPKPPRTPEEIMRDRQRLAIVEGIDARHKQALDATGAANEAARARYDRDVQRFGPEGIAGAVTAQAQAEQRAIDAAVGTHEAKGEADRAFLEKKAALLEEQAAASQNVIDGIRRTADDLKSAKIDPNAFWASRSTPQKLALAIASGMGAFAQAMGQGPNTAQGIIDKAIDDDVRAQLANVDKKSKDLTAGQQLYKQILDQTGDKIAAADALRLAAYSAVDSKLAEAQQTAKSEQALSRIQELRGRYEQQRLEQEAALSERMRGTEGVNFRVDPARAASYGGGPNLDRIAALQQAMVSASHGQAMVDMALGEAAAKAAKGTPRETATVGNLTYDLTNVTSAGEGAGVRDKIGAIDVMDHWLGVVEKAQSDFVNKRITKAQLENAVQRYASWLSKAEAQGVVKEDELKRMESTMGALMNGEAVVGDLRKSHATLRNSILTQAGAVPRRAR